MSPIKTPNILRFVVTPTTRGLLAQIAQEWHIPMQVAAGVLLEWAINQHIAENEHCRGQLMGRAKKYREEQERRYGGWRKK